MVEQLLREWPPGYGGVERVAHELANVWGGAVYSLDVQRQAAMGDDPCPLPMSVVLFPVLTPSVVCTAIAVLGPGGFVLRLFTAISLPREFCCCWC